MGGSGKYDSSSHRDHRESDRRDRSTSRDESWKNVRVKEEPLSDVEGSSRRHDRRREELSRDRERGHSRLEDASSSRNRRRSRSPNHRHESRSKSSRDDRGYRDQRPIKSEPRSRSRSPPREFFPPPPRRDRHEPQDRRPPRRDRFEDREPQPSHSSRGSDSRPHEPKREKDWNEFFNPKSEMSQQAVAKKEQEDNEREERLQEYDHQGQGGGKDDENANVEKEKPNFGLSGKLTEETNTYKGIVIKYSEPPEARKPIKTRWRLYPFKDGESLQVMYVHRQSAYLIGRERKIADIPVDHPSCSKQHAVLQYRLIPFTRPDGSKGRRIRPYIIDLESSNGTYVNGERIDPKRYVELFEKDVLKFGFSSREYVLLHDNSKDNEPLDDDGYEKSPSPD